MSICGHTVYHVSPSTEPQLHRAGSRWPTLARSACKFSSNCKAHIQMRSMWATCMQISTCRSHAAYGGHTLHMGAHAAYGGACCYAACGVLKNKPDLVWIMHILHVCAMCACSPYLCYVCMLTLPSPSPSRVTLAVSSGYGYRYGYVCACRHFPSGMAMVTCPLPHLEAGPHAHMPAGPHAHMATWPHAHMPAGAHEAPVRESR